MTGRSPAGAAAVAAVLLGLAAPAAAAAAPPPAPTPQAASSAPEVLDTLSRFFARDGAVARAAAHPRIEGATVPVRFLSADFVAGKPGAPVAELQFYAAGAVSSDGQKASVWTARQGAGWQVVNIATGDDETRYAAQGARRLPGGTVFREPQIDAWYVHKGAKVLPLDEDAVRAVGANGTTLTAYRARVTKAYADKLPGSAYAKKGTAGGYDRPDSHTTPAVTLASVTAGAGAVVALALIATAARRRRTAPPS